LTNSGIVKNSIEEEGKIKKCRKIELVKEEGIVERFQKGREGGSRRIKIGLASLMMRKRRNEEGVGEMWKRREGGGGSRRKILVELPRRRRRGWTEVGEK